MSPEQVSQNRDLDHRSDVYGCAMLLYRMLAGRPPYRGATMLEVATKQLSAPIPSLPDALADDPIAVVYRKAGNKDRDQRYGSAARMAWALRCINDPSVRNTPPPDDSELLKLAKRGFFKRLFGL